MVNEILNKVGCGWCLTGDHAGCKGWTKSYDTIWICGCTKTDTCGASSPRNTDRTTETGTVQSPQREQTTVPVEQETTSTEEGTDTGTENDGTEVVVLDDTSPKRRGRPKKAD